MALRPVEAPLPPGKLPAKLLERLLKKYASDGTGVVVGPSIGIDSAVLDLKKGYLVAKTDPITFVAEEIGSYAVDINANDIAVMGGTPRWFLATILLPSGKATASSVERIFKGLSSACKKNGVTLCGGHTEITFGIDRPIIIGQMLGEVPKDRVITSAGAVPGDDIILTKGIAIEAVSIIARNFAPELEKRFGAPFVKKCRGFIKTPGISVLKDAKIALRCAEVHAMHDPTEGGLSTGLFEVAKASGCGIILEREASVLPEAARLFRYFGLDPMGCIASGALIIAVGPKGAKKTLKTLEKAGIPAWRIGRVTGRNEGLLVAGAGGNTPMRLFERDEITRLF